MPSWFKRKSSAPAPEGAGDSRTSAELVEAGIAAESRGDANAAERYFREAVKADPGSAVAQMNLGIALQGRGNAAAAAAAQSAAVRLDPMLAGAQFNLGRACLDLQDMAGAERGFRQALRLRPQFPEAWVGLAETLESAGRLGDALGALDNAIAQREFYVGALFNSALLLRRLGRLDEAQARLRGVPEGHAEYANARTALAALLRDLGRVEEAIEILRPLAARTSGAGTAGDEFLFTLCFSDRLSDAGLFEAHARAGALMESATPLIRAGFPNTPEPDRVLNIGYLSGDFRRHSVALFIEHLFERHRRDSVKVHAYSSTPQHDAVTARFIAGADVWRDLRGQPDANVAAAILEDRIDILVDLSGHTTPARIPVLAARAAPVQMTWLGCNNTTGLKRIDYRISDEVSDPMGLTEALHTERLLRMPHCQWCFRPPADAAGIEPLRDPAVPAFTFGALNQFAKVSQSTIALWIDVLRAAPSARLRIGSVPLGEASERLAGILTQAGIARTRFDLFHRVALEDYYLHYRQVDACLDTTPYSGCTTTCDALWFGVPVITLAGVRSVSRSSASILSTLGRPELVARTPAQFTAIAAGLAAAGGWPIAARIALRAKFAACALMDEPLFARDLEALYRRAWRDWCSAQPSAPIGAA